MSEDFNEGTTVSSLAVNWYLEKGPIIDEKAQYPVCHDPANISIANGYGYFNTAYSDTPRLRYKNKEYHYSTCSIKSRHDDFPGVASSGGPGGALYGMFEIRCKLPGREGQAPCLWLTGHNAWPPEIDAFEYSGSNPKEFFSTVHYKNPAYAGDSTQPKNIGCGDTYRFSINLYEEFHTWTVVWTPDAITWFFDEIELKSDSIPEHIPGAPSWGSNSNVYELCNWEKMDVLIGSGLNYPNDNTLFEPFIVDYIHVYKPIDLPPYKGKNLPKYIGKKLWPIYRSSPYKKHSSH